MAWGSREASPQASPKGGPKVALQAPPSITPRTTRTFRKEAEVEASSGLDSALHKPKRLLPGQVDDAQEIKKLERQLTSKEGGTRGVRAQSSLQGEVDLDRAESLVREKSGPSPLKRQMTTRGSLREEAKSPGSGIMGSMKGSMKNVFGGGGGGSASPTKKHHGGSHGGTHGDDVGANIKSAVEVLLEAKVTQFRHAVKKFRLDMLSMVVYLIFTAFFTISIVGRGETKQIFFVREAIENTLINVGGYPGPKVFGTSEVGSMSDIYLYLEQVVIPNVATANMTTLSPLCDAAGRDLNLNCDEKQGQCCTTQQPNPSVFVTGGNLMVTGVKVRQLRALSESTQTYQQDVFVDSYLTPWTTQVDEGRDGGGTTKQWDKRGELIDWPVEASYYNYQQCVPTLFDTCFVADARAKYRETYSANGFTATLSGYDTDMMATVADLKARGFLDSRATRAVFIDFTAYLPNRKLFCIVTLLFENIDLGAVTPTHTIYVTDLHQGVPILWDILEYGVFGYAMLLMIVDLVAMYRMGMAYWSSGWAVYVSWINYGLFVAAFVLRLILETKYQQIKSIAPLSPEAEAFPWQEVAFEQETVYFITSFNALLTWLRVLSHLEAISPKTRQLTQTISQSGGDLASLTILIFVVLTGFSIGFHLAFGRNVDGHKDIVGSLSALLQAILGQFDYEDLKGVNPIMAPLFFVSYIAIVMFLMLNMFMAVVMKTYDKVQDYLAGAAAKEVTGTGLLKRQINQMVRLIKAGDLEQVQGEDTDDVGSPSGRKSRGGANTAQDWDEKETLTVADVQVLFRDDPDLLSRMSVKTFKELIRLADTDGRHFLPFSEVREILQSEKQRAESRFSIHSVYAEKEAGGGSNIDPAQIQLLVDNIVKREMEKQQREMQAFIQAQISNMGLILAGVNQAQGMQPEPPTDKKPWSVSKADGPQGEGGGGGGSPSAKKKVGFGGWGGAP